MFNLYTEHIIRNVGLDELQAGIKISERNSNNLRYVNGTTLMAESKEELKSLLMRLKEENERVCLRLTIKKKKKNNKDSGICPHYCMATKGNNVEVVTDILFWGSCGW